MTISQELGARSSTSLPHDLVELLRPEVESLTTEIMHEIRTTIPEYHRPHEPRDEASVRSGVEYALTLFVDQIADPESAPDKSLEFHRTLGQRERRAQRGLDNVLAAYRLGSRMSWRRLMDIGAHAQLSSGVMSELADALLAFLDELTTAAIDGYLHTAPHTVDTQGHRQQLLQRILAYPPAPQDTLAELAEQARWDLPAEVSLVAVQSRESSAYPPQLDRLGHDILAEMDGDTPYLLIPDTVTDPQVTELRSALAGRRLAIGPCVPLESAAESLRLARTALDLAADGTLPRQRVLRVEHHLSTMLLHSDTVLLDQLRRRWFARLDTSTPKQRKRILTTLHTWLDTQGSVSATAQHLGVHTQTVRYRLRRIEAVFGEHLHHPDSRFEMHTVLRADAQHRGSLP